MTTLIPKFQQTGTGAVNRPINQKLTETVSVKDFGAVGDGTTDDTAAIQAALDASITSTILFPIGNYKITDTLLITYSTGSGAAGFSSVNLQGQGFGSNIKWYGGNNKPMIQYVGVNGKGFYSNTTIQGLHLSVEDSSTGVTGLLFGDTTNVIDTLSGVGNVTIRNNIIYSCGTGIHTWVESDEFTIIDNHIRVHQSYGIRNQGGSGYLIARNHIQDGDADSLGIYSGATAITITSNVIQSYTNIRGIFIEGARGFSITDNYSESVVQSSTYFIRLKDSTAGYIGQNEIGGYIDANLIKIESTSNIQIASNWHSQSGGFINSLVNIDGASTGIALLGKQGTSGAVNTIIGDPVIYIQAGVVQGLKFYTNSGANTINALGGTATLFSATALIGAAWIVFAQEGAAGSKATGFFCVADGGASATFFSTGATGGTGVALSASGLNLVATNASAAIITVGWTLTRVY
jgi:hypothetical protein